MPRTLSISQLHLAGKMRKLYVMCAFVTVCCQTAASEKDNFCINEEKNISVALLGQNVQIIDPTTSVVGSDLKFYLSICAPFSDRTIDDSFSKYCPDPKSSICITKVSPNSTEVAFISNAGTIQKNSFQYKSPQKSELTLPSGQACKEDPSTNYSSHITFACFDDPSMVNNNNGLIFNSLVDCVFDFIWATNLICPRKSSDSCQVYLPNSRRKIDLGKLLAADSFYPVHSDDRHFQLNICANVKNGSCPKGSKLCEVNEDTQLKKNIVQPEPVVQVDVPEDSDGAVSITLHYISDDNTVNVIIKCDTSQEKPRITFEKEDSVGNTPVYLFYVFTKSICPEKKLPCKEKNFDLSALQMNDKWISRTDDPNVEFELSVCRPMSSSPCAGTAATVCRVNRKTGEAVTIASTEEEFHVAKNSESVGSGQIWYGGGDLCHGQVGYHAHITFHCSDVEKGPQFTGMESDCIALFDWFSPAACTGDKQESAVNECKVKEDMFGHVFDLSPLHNSEKDIDVSTPDGTKYRINICGGLASECAGAMGGAVCMTSDNKDNILGEKSRFNLSHVEGQLSMDFNSEVKCKQDSRQNLKTKIIFACDHKAEHTVPAFVENGGCTNYFLWSTNLACPPFREVECGVTSPLGETYDLSSLSNTHSNYWIETSEQEKFELNVCRSIIHTQTSKCPYQSAVCRWRKDKEWSYTNIGEVDGSPTIDDHGRLILAYNMGTICTDQDDKETHMRTEIVFKCKPGELDSKPELLDQIGCTFRFLWQHAAACPIHTRTITGGNCSVTDAKSGRVFDLSPLRIDQNLIDSLKTTDRDGNTYFVNVCGPISSANWRCDEQAGVCRDDNNRKHTNLGNFNDRVILDKDFLLLNYSNGDVCEEKKEFKYNSLLRVMCSFEQASTTHLAIAEKHDCSTIFDLHTPLACDHEIPCDVVDDEGNIYRLSTLMKYDSNYESATDTRYKLNVCKRLKGNSNAAVTYTDSRRTLNYGVPISSPKLLPNGDIVLSYTGGSECEEGRKRSSNITFKCSKTAYPGEPTLTAGSSDCHLNFLWKTKMACLHQDFIHEHKPSEGKCMVFNDILNDYVDLTGLMSQYKIVMAGSSDQFSIQSCGMNPSCSPGTICMTDGSSWHSMGVMSLSMYDYNEDTLKVTYSNGDPCPSHGSRYSAEVHYQCDQDGGAAPTLVDYDRYSCRATFEWRTKDVCRSSRTAVIPNDQTSSSAGQIIGVLFLLVSIGLCIFYLRKPEHRETVRRHFVWLRVKLCFRVGRGSDDSPLVNTSIRVPAFGSLDDDEELILA